MELSFRAIRSEECDLIVAWNHGKGEDYFFQWAGFTCYQYPLTAIQIQERLGEENMVVYLVLQDDNPIGSIELMNIDNQMHTAKICRFILSDKVKGQGYGTTVLKKMVKYAFEKLDLKSLYLNVYAYNIGAIRCYEKSGFLVKQYYQNENPHWNYFTMQVDRVEHKK